MEPVETAVGFNGGGPGRNMLKMDVKSQLLVGKESFQLRMRTGCFLLKQATDSCSNLPLVGGVNPSVDCLLGQQ